MPDCYGQFDGWDDYCWYYCPHSYLCEKVANGYPFCYGYFDDYDCYCWDCCSCSHSCEIITWDYLDF